MDGFVPPIKLVFSGDDHAARQHIKFATNQLAILERQMSFQGLNEGRRVVSPYHGVTVECLSSFSRHEVRIHVDKAPASQQMPVAKPVEIAPKKRDEDIILTLFAAGSFANYGWGKRMLGVVSDQVGTATPFTAATSPTVHHNIASNSFQQVKYLPESYAMQNQDDEDVSKRLSFSLTLTQQATYCTIIVTAEEQIDDDETDTTEYRVDSLDNGVSDISQAAQVARSVKVHKFEIDIAGTDNITANFSADKSKLYVVKWGVGHPWSANTHHLLLPVYEIYELNPVWSEGWFAIYDRVLMDGVITWTLRVSGDISVPCLMSGPFIDKEGFLYGFYKAVEVEQDGPPEASLNMATANPVVGGYTGGQVFVSGWENNMPLGEWTFLPTDMNDPKITSWTTAQTSRTADGHASSSEYLDGLRTLNKYYRINLETIGEENIGIPAETEIVPEEQEKACGGTIILAATDLDIMGDPVNGGGPGDFSGMFSMQSNNFEWEAWGVGTQIFLSPWWRSFEYQNNPGPIPPDYPSYGVVINNYPGTNFTYWETVNQPWITPLDMLHHTALENRYLPASRPPMRRYLPHNDPESVPYFSIRYWTKTVVKDGIPSPGFGELPIGSVATFLGDMYANAPMLITDTGWFGEYYQDQSPVPWPDEAWVWTGERLVSVDVQTHGSIPIHCYKGTSHFYDAHDFVYPGEAYGSEWDNIEILGVGASSVILTPPSYHTIFPIQISNSQPTKAFVVYDQTTTPPRDFRGVYYADKNDADALKWKITLNGFDVTQALFSLLECEHAEVDHLGILF